MPRIPRGVVESNYLHVINRAHERATIFRDWGDYARFVSLLEEAKHRYRVGLFSFAVMPNHFHLVTYADQSAELSRFMQWWMTSYVRLHHTLKGTSGYLWQGRFKSFPIQRDDHLLRVNRYVLRNPVRAALAARARDWPWTSLKFASLVDPWPVAPPTALESWLADPPPESETEAIRECIRRRRPYGDEEWVEQVAEQSGLGPTLRPRGRPRKVDGEGAGPPENQLEH